MIVGLTLVVLSMGVSNKASEETRERMLQESINTLEDMHEWMLEDINSGKIEQEVGDTYLANIDGTAVDLANMTCCY